MEIYQVVILALNLLIWSFCGFTLFKLWRMEKKHKKTMEAFNKIKSVMGKGIDDKISPEQLYFRLIQVREQFDAETINETKINSLIHDLKLIK